MLWFHPHRDFIELQLAYNKIQLFKMYDSIYCNKYVHVLTLTVTVTYFHHPKMFLCGPWRLIP
jgi:hypothetical protein